jgi:hypothetical protein
MCHDYNRELNESTNNINFKSIISRFSSLNQSLLGLIHNNIISLFKKI